MNENTLIILAVALVIILGILAFNMYQESKYRRNVRKQFGHSDNDALLNDNVNKVRDGQSLQHDKINGTNQIKTEDISRSIDTNDFDHKTKNNNNENDIQIKEKIIASENTVTTENFDFKTTVLPNLSQTTTDRNKLLIGLDYLSNIELSWFDTRFDYLAYISLKKPQELHAIPRLSNRNRFQIIGCTMDNSFQVAEPIPSVYYQGFVVGLQSISRSGLITAQEIEHFNEQVNIFAQKIDGALLLTDANEFLEVARSLDELCARVDQTIAIHLVSKASISGIELRKKVEKEGFELAVDGTFQYLNKNGKLLFSIVTLDNTPFTPSLLSSQTYRGFSILFDIPHVNSGDKQFDHFLDIAVKLSSNLALDLVNDKLEELSTQWLKEVRKYVLARQEEMKKVGIEPAGELANRLFS